MTSEAPSVTALTPSLIRPRDAPAQDDRRTARSSRVEARSSHQILLSLVRAAVPGADHLDGAVGAQAERRSLHRPPKLFGSEIMFSSFAEAWNCLPFGRFILNTMSRSPGIGHLDRAGGLARYWVRVCPIELQVPGRPVPSSTSSTLIVSPGRSSSIPMFLVDAAGSAGSTRTRPLILPWAFTAFRTFLLRDNSSLHHPAKSWRKPPRSMAAGTSASSAASSSRWRPRLSRSGRLHVLHHLLEQLLVAADHRERHQPR